MNDEADDWELFDLDEGEVVVVEAAKKEIKCIHVPKSNSSYVKNKWLTTQNNNDSSNLQAAVEPQVVNVEEVVIVWQ